jgi:shikimate dehydrogenase
LIGIVGSPVDQVRSPQLLTRLFAEAGRNTVCIAFAVGAPHLEAFFRGIRNVGNLDGLLVTMPHKRSAAALVDSLVGVARRLGAINIARPEADGTWSGAMFDGVGCVLALRWVDAAPMGRHVLLVGAGGAGGAIGLAVAQAGATRLTITDTDDAAAQRLANLVAMAAPDCDVAACEPVERAPLDIIVNATPLGMRSDDPLPVAAAMLAPGVAVVDLVNAPAVTPLCTLAASRGCRVVTGQEMHDGQCVYAARYLGLDYWPSNRPRLPLEPAIAP